MARLVAIVFLSIAAAAHAASFDCSTAGNNVEHIICGDSQISHLDEQLARNYKSAMQDQSHAMQTRQAQRRWIKERNNCRDADCVREAYIMRIAQLSATHGAETQTLPVLAPPQNNKEKQTNLLQQQAPQEVAGIERWYMEQHSENWSSRSHMYLSLVIEGDHVCGLLYSSAMGANRLDRSLLAGKLTSGRIEVQYASSYYSKQNQVATAHLERRGNQLLWKPVGSGLSASWFWGSTILSHTDKSYVPLTKWNYEQCKILWGKTYVEAFDLHLDP